MSDTPETMKMLDQILERDGELNNHNSPTEWVKLSKRLERKYAADIKMMNERLIEAIDRMQWRINQLREELRIERAAKRPIQEGGEA